MEAADGGKQYSLRWEKHAFNLATEAGCFFEDESFLDCTLSAEGRCIDAHKIILSASSSYLSEPEKLARFMVSKTGLLASKNRFYYSCRCNNISGTPIASENRFRMYCFKHSWTFEKTENLNSYILHRKGRKPLNYIVNALEVAVMNMQRKQPNIDANSLLKLMPDKHPILIFNDMKFEQLKSLVAFIYNGSVNIAENEIHAFLNAAQSLLIKGLYEEESKDNMKASEQIKRAKKNNHFTEFKRNNHRYYDRIPPLRKPEIFQESGRFPKKERPILPKVYGLSQTESEDNLNKLQEISFMKYINQNLNSKPLVTSGEEKWNDSSDEKSKGQENYVVKSWKHNSIDDVNGPQKQNKSNLYKKLKLEKANIPPTEQINPNEKGRIPLDYDLPEGNRRETESNDNAAEGKIKKESVEQRFLIEPKQEMIEEEEMNSEIYVTKGLDANAELNNAESESTFDNRRGRNYFHHAVDAGIPVPLLMCKTSLNEPDSSDLNWIPQINNSTVSDHSTQSLQNENVHDSQCRTCSQDLPCPTCTKKYKSRYALNRHILYECGKARKSFSCDECGKKVTRQDTLQKHKLIHLVQHLKDKESESELPDSPKAKKKC